MCVDTAKIKEETATIHELLKELSISGAWALRRHGLPVLADSAKHQSEESEDKASPIPSIDYLTRMVDDGLASKETQASDIVRQFEATCRKDPKLLYQVTVATYTFTKFLGS